ncbi:hypothetical protein WN51_03512 [Melipona quadrifasciata]|uniref:Uncharacterized protein n=1 Tax=Melipona quadrifasciata TaxID=166423 RepID=A0A0N0U450_9HYME|nr:hypothetical protein WN51_03512 [Melipona quadrifasciata]
MSVREKRNEKERENRQETKRQGVRERERERDAMYSWTALARGGQAEGVGRG